MGVITARNFWDAQRRLWRAFLENDPDGAGRRLVFASEQTSFRLMPVPEWWPDASVSQLRSAVANAERVGRETAAERRR